MSCHRRSQVPDMFITDTRFTFVRTGESATRKGRAVVYTGFQWRGRYDGAAPETVWREVIAVDRTRREMRAAGSPAPTTSSAWM